jgi:hypothetical protein
LVDFPDFPPVFHCFLGPLFLRNGSSGDSGDRRILDNLNNRLASYIEKVRNLELENGRLEQQVGPVAFSYEK